MILMKTIKIFVKDKETIGIVSDVEIKELNKILTIKHNINALIIEIIDMIKYSIMKIFIILF